MSETQPIRRAALLLTETRPGSDAEAAQMVKLYNLLAGWVADQMPEPSAPTREPISGYVYFMQATGGGPIKIGWSIKPLQRLSACRTGTPVRLSLLAAMPAKRPDESIMHARFESARLRGEWFKPVPELMALIESLKAAGAPGSRWTPDPAISQPGPQKTE